MKTVVITGSTRGIGYGLADQFLLRGCQVVINGRAQASVDQAVATLNQKHHETAGPGSRIFGFAADMADYEQVQDLWNAACTRFGKIDIWINNAGLGNLLTPFWELDPERIRTVVEANVIGTMYGSKVAINGMLKQGYGSLYNMEGYGSRGKRITPGLALYGTTKAALAFLDNSLAVELQGTRVQSGAILPGMVVTDLLLNQRSGSPADWERSKKAFNILADKVETVAPWIVDQVLKNDRHGKQIRWLNGAKLMGRFLATPFTKRKIID